jgi:hypothetical protein
MIYSGKVREDKNDRSFLEGENFLADRPTTAEIQFWRTSGSLGYWQELRLSSGYSMY